MRYVSAVQVMKDEHFMFFMFCVRRDHSAVTAGPDPRQRRLAAAEVCDPVS